MIAWYRFLRELGKSKEALSVIVCRTRGSRFHINFKYWHLRLGLYSLLALSIITPTLALTSFFYYTKQTRLLNELFFLRSEIFSYQVRHDDVYEKVYEINSPESNFNLTVENNFEGLDHSGDPARSNIDHDKAIIQGREKAAQPDSIFPEAIVPNLALSPDAHDSGLSSLPIKVSLEWLNQGLSSTPKLRLRIQNLAYPQSLELRIWLRAMAMTEQFETVYIAYPSPEMVDWYDGQLIDASKSLAINLTGESWHSELELSPPHEIQFSEWRAIQFYVLDQHGQQLGEFSYQLGQLSARLLSPGHIH